MLRVLFSWLLPRSEHVAHLRTSACIHSLLSKFNVCRHVGVKFEGCSVGLVYTVVSERGLEWIKGVKGAVTADRGSLRRGKSYCHRRAWATKRRRKAWCERADACAACVYDIRIYRLQERSKGASSVCSCKTLAGLLRTRARLLRRPIKSPFIYMPARRPFLARRSRRKEEFALIYTRRATGCAPAYSGSFTPHALSCACFSCVGLFIRWLLIALSFFTSIMRALRLFMQFRLGKS